MGILGAVKSAAKLALARRSPKWRALEVATLRLHPSCAACGGVLHLQVHHVLPFHLHRELELDPTNLIVLCEAPGKDCHLAIGHGGSFRAFNPDVRAMAAAVLAEPTARALYVARARAIRRFE